jgi:hypothetical protein
MKQKKMKKKSAAAQEIRFLGKIGFLNRARYFLGRLKNIRNVTIIRENDMPERVIKFISLIPLVLSLV